MLIHEKYIRYGQYANDFNIERILIGSTVESIGDFAFSRCNNLCDIDFSQAFSLFSLGIGAFYNCISLTDIRLPPVLTSIGQECFHRCYSLVHIELSRNLEYIPEFAFDRCRSLQEISIPESVISIEKRAFSKCYSLKKVMMTHQLYAKIKDDIEYIFLDNIPAFTFL